MVSEFRIKRDPAKLLGSAVARSTQTLGGRNMTVRPYSESDLEAVVVVFTSSVHVLGASEYSDAQRKAWAPQPPDLSYWRKRLRSLQTFVATDAAAVIGFLSYEPNGHIEFLYVAPQYARRGVASMLCARAETVLASSRVAELFTEASLVARPFFERVGFSVHRAREVSFGGASFTRYAMRKRLSAA